MTQGIRISKAGIGVGTADEKDLIYSSEFNSPKIYAQGTASIVSNGTSSQSYTVYNHGLNYYPAYRFYFKHDGYMYADNGYDGVAGVTWVSKMGTGSLFVDAAPFLPAGTYPSHYFILADPAKVTATGLQPTGNIGLKITNAGTPPSSTDLKDYSLHSNYPAFNMLAVATITTTGANEVGSVAHGLGFRPAFAGVVEDTGGTATFWYDLPYVIPNQVNYEAFVDATYVYARAKTISGTATRTFKVTLFNKEI